MFYSINIMFIMLLLISTMIVLSTPSWFCMWIGIEMNTMAFIPLMYKFNNKLPTESTLKYFLTQTFASMIMMLAIITIMTKSFNLMYNPSMLMISSMAIKIGAAPFHMWYPSVIEGLNWGQISMMMTWQKIAPFYIMANTFPSKMHLMVSISSLIIGSAGAFNQTSTRKIMAYSSISHSAWIIIMMFYYSNLWMTYMLIYFTTIIIMISTFMTMNINHIMQMNNIKSMYMQTLTFINLLSMGGFPPLLGFTAKWLILNELMKNNMIMLPMIMIISSWVNLYIYIRIIHPLMLTKSYKTKSHINNKIPYNTMSMMTLLSLSSLPIMVF